MFVCVCLFVCLFSCLAEAKHGAEEHGKRRRRSKADKNDTADKDKNEEEEEKQEPVPYMALYRFATFWVGSTVLLETVPVRMLLHFVV